MAWSPGRAAIRTSRLLTAAVLLPILVGLIWQLNSFFFFLFISLVILRVQYEFYLLFFPSTTKRPIIFGLFLGFSLSCLFYYQPTLLGTSLLLFLIGIFLYSLFSFQDIQKTMTESAVLFLGVAYISGFLSHLFLIRDLPQGKGLIVLILLMTWGGDAGAYYVGRAWGKHKLSPRVSPNKTVEGAIGGLVTTLAGGVLMKISLLPLLSWEQVLSLSLLLGFFGQLGDLTESMLKRSAGVKDSSSLIPAHGGLFDKLDSIAFAAPLLYYYIIFSA